jgi:hypothetical protein
MADPVKRTVTVEQANEALRALAAEANGDEPQPATEEPTPVAAEAPVAEAPVEEPPAESAPEAATAADGDDVVSLKKRLEEREQEVKRVTELHEQRLKAAQERFSQNEQILRQRFLRKATAAERALQTLKGTRTKEGVAETDVDRVIAEIEATMNPASPSYAAPPPGQVTPSEDQAIIFNSFLNEKGMSLDEAAEFGRWIQAESATKLSQRELAVSERDLDGFLRIAHVHWANGARDNDKAKVRTDAVAAVQAVKHVQREAARATAPPSAPRKQPAAAPSSPQYADVKKMTPEARQKWVSDLVKASVEEYR